MANFYTGYCFSSLGRWHCLYSGIYPVFLYLFYPALPLSSPTPSTPTKSAKKSQQISGTNQRTNFSAKQLPTDLDLGSIPQTHLPFGCCAVRVM